MNTGKDSQFGQFKWHIVIVAVSVAAIFGLVLFTQVFENTDTLRDLVFLMGSLIFLAALLAMLSRVSGIVNTLRDNSTKMEDAARALEKISEGLSQIRRSTSISETVKAIAFREEDRQSLREAVFDKLKQKDVDAYRNATEDERIDQAIVHVETLFNSSQWAKASVQIEALIKAHPHLEKVKSLRQKLVDRKDEHKKILLAAWDDAVQQQETDRSLEILKELDMYLSPSEGLALQEAAKDVFRTKLHKLGVEFAMAVSDRQWDHALEIGQQIVRDFPNSRMSQEIREKLDVLRQNVQVQHA